MSDTKNRQVFVTHYPSGDVGIEIHNDFGSGEGWPDKAVTFKGYEIAKLIELLKDK